MKKLYWHSDVRTIWHLCSAVFLTLPVFLVRVWGHVECFSTCINRLLSSSSLPVRPAGPHQNPVYVSARGCVCVDRWVCFRGFFMFNVYTTQSKHIIVGLSLCWLAAVCELLSSVTESCCWATSWLHLLLTMLYVAAHTDIVSNSKWSVE